MMQPPSHRSAIMLAVAIAGGAATASSHADPAPSRAYVVKAGDTCVSIAERELGDRALYAKIHELNPSLGRLPHNLVPGTVLRLPGAGPARPDATVAATRGAVHVRPPEIDRWDPASVGLGLFRAWRVRAQERSSAELEFLDRSRLLMRENSIVIILGSSAPSTIASRTEAELESGGLESRLESGRRQLIVRTPSSEAVLAGGRSLVSVVPGGTSVVANHAGAAVSVRGVDPQRRATGRSVAVAAGMGSKVEPRKPPTPPRALPPAPAWTAGPDRFIDLGGSGGHVAIAWAAVPAAASYRVEVVTAAGGEVAATEVPASVTALELYRVAPGDYVARVATIDAERFESVRSVDRGFQVVVAQVIPPGAAAAIAPAPASAPGVDLTAAPPLRLATGSRVVAPAGMACGLPGAPPTAELALATAGEVAIECAALDGAAPPAQPVRASVVPLRVAREVSGPAPLVARGTTTPIRVTIAADAAYGTALTVRASRELRVVSTTPGDGVLDIVVEATGEGADRGQLTLVAGEVEVGAVELAIAPAPPRASASAARRRWLSIGAYTGYHAYPDDPRAGSALGDASDPARAIGPGPIVGVTLGAAVLPRLGVELEAGVISARWAGAEGRAAVVSWRAHADLTFLTVGRADVHALIGTGGDALIRTIPGTRRDHAFVLDRGLRLSVRDGAARRWWLEVRDDVHPSRDGGSADVLSVRAGLLRDF